MYFASKEKKNDANVFKEKHIPYLNRFLWQDSYDRKTKDIVYPSMIQNQYVHSKNTQKNNGIARKIT